MTPDELRRRLREDPAVVGVRLLVLHGSRARGTAHGGSDWDLLLRPGPDTEPGDVTASAVLVTGTDAVDVADLDRAGALLRFRAARDGILLAGDPAEFLAFREEAVRYWCDAGPVIRAALADVLDGLDPAGVSETLDEELLAERAAAVVRHRDRVAEHLPVDPDDLRPMTSSTDTVVLHLWQAVQVVIDLAVSSCVRLGLGSPPTYADAFRQLAGAQVLPDDLAGRLARAAGFRNLVVHGYGQLDLRRVHAVAAAGPGDLRAFLTHLRDAARR